MQMSYSEERAQGVPYAITATKEPWWQWDTGLQVKVDADELRQVHFADKPNGTAYVVDVEGGYANVPDELLQVPQPVKAWGYVPDGDRGATYVEATFKVLARNKPSGYVWTKTAQKTIADAEQARDDAQAAQRAAEEARDQAKEYERLAGEHAADAEGAAGAAAADAIAAAKPTLDQYKADAKASADNAKASETAAASSASAAAASAAKAAQEAGSAASAVTDSLKGYVQQATAQANASKASADASAASAATAGTRANAASASASNAAEQATAAQNYATQAKQSQSGAATSATNASASATKASDSQAKAKASADAAAASAKEAADTVADCMKASTFGDVYGTVEPLVTTEEDATYTTSLAHDASLAVTAGLLGVNRDAIAPKLNTLIGTAEDAAFVHVEDAFEGGALRGFTIQGKCEQITTTGANLWPQCPAKTESGVTFEPYADRHGHADRGMVKVSGTATAAYVCTEVQAELEPGEYSFKNFGYYKGSASSLAGAVYLRVRVVPASGSQTTYTAYQADTTSFTVAEGDSVFLDVMCGTAGSVDIGAVMPMLVKGSMPSAWEQYTGGKASPSPEYPQEIDVAETVGLVRTGRNLIDEMALADNNKTYYSYSQDGLIVLQSDGRASSDIPKTQAWPFTSYVTSSLHVEVSDSLWGFTLYNQSTAKTRNTAKSVHIKIGFGRDDYPVISDVIASVEEGVSYRTSDFFTASIPLPEEHPYLASLPDGTHDEITVDETGHAVLTARVGKIPISELSTIQIHSDSSGPLNFIYKHIDAMAGRAITARALSTFVHARNSVHTDNYGSVCVTDTALTSASDIAELFGKDEPVYYLLGAPVAYDLGYVSLPSQPDRYCNFWVSTGDAETSPTCPLSVTYERDVNIVIDQLEQAIASVSGE